MKKILLAGATGYLGSHIASKLNHDEYELRVIVRSPDKLKQLELNIGDVFQAEITRPETIKGCCSRVDTVISTVGITRQKDGLTYMDVDYQANMNLLTEALRSGVRKFVYVSVLNGEKLRHLKICDAKERFVDELRKSGLEYCVIRPNGFFSDIAEIHAMASNGRVYLFGSGEQKTNPIHGEDLADACIDAIEQADLEIKIGGPDTLTFNEIANIAFKSMAKETKVTHIPDWVRKTILKSMRLLTSSKTYGPIEFFLTVTSIDMTAPERGTHHLKDHFNLLSESIK
ncbi:MAG: SDR family oxidoreductase [Desulfofustis sp.]|nr:SDR family oxidoreductase [Desulfofustis sp.]